MSRRGSNGDIGDIIDLCKEYKLEAKKFTDLAKPLEAKIKDYAKANPKLRLMSESYEAKVSIIPRQDLDEEKAIAKLKEVLPKSKFEKVVKSRLYIDNDELEKLIYSNYIQAELLAPCMVEKEPTVKLLINKLKKEDK